MGNNGKKNEVKKKKLPVHANILIQEIDEDGEVVNSYELEKVVHYSIACSRLIIGTHTTQFIRTMSNPIGRSQLIGMCHTLLEDLNNSPVSLPAALLEPSRSIDG